MPSSFDKEFEACLSIKSLPPQEHFDMLLGILKQHKMMYYMEEVHPRFFMVVVADRDYLRVSPRIAHGRGAQV